MSLPVKFSNVHYYRIAGRYTFAGDLFIARNAIYFFPEVDLAEERRQATEHLPHHFALFAFVILYLAQTFRTFSGNDLWDETLSDAEFQTKARGYIEYLKAGRTGKGFAESLPLPLRVSTGEFSDIKLSAMGKLSFQAESDNHDFGVGVIRKRRLRDALWEAGLGKV